MLACGLQKFPKMPSRTTGNVHWRDWLRGRPPLFSKSNASISFQPPGRRRCGKCVSFIVAVPGGKLTGNSRLAQNSASGISHGQIEDEALESTESRETWGRECFQVPTLSVTYDKRSAFKRDDFTQVLVH